MALIGNPRGKLPEALELEAKEGLWYIPDEGDMASSSTGLLGGTISSGTGPV